MKIGLILSGFSNYDLVKTCDFLIGVDKGAINAINNNIKLDYAIGDFDSVSKEEFDLIDKSTKIMKLNREKDFTDTAVAIKTSNTISKDITIFGGIQGKRIEHFIANINLLIEYPNLVMIDDNSKIFIANESVDLSKETYKYISVYAIDEVPCLNMLGFKYELNNYNLKPFDSLITSNEFTNDSIITLDKGKILIILSNNDSVNN